jgi:hypothetical protein
MYWLAMHRYVMNIPHQITACPDRSRLNVRR